jgi:hypothetical protein
LIGQLATRDYRRAELVQKTCSSTTARGERLSAQELYRAADQLTTAGLVRQVVRANSSTFALLTLAKEEFEGARLFRPLRKQPTWESIADRLLSAASRAALLGGLEKFVDAYHQSPTGSMDRMKLESDFLMRQFCIGGTTVTGRALLARAFQVNATTIIPNDARTFIQHLTS